MAQIGNLGKLIVFEVSSDKILTFQKMTQTVKGRWSAHAVIQGKPVSEFLGPDQRQGSLSIYLSSALGVKPRTVIEEIEKAVESGMPNQLVVGGKKIGNNEWVITSMSETWGAIIKDGCLVAANLSLTLAEYV